jgi:hypothetical protein
VSGAFLGGRAARAWSFKYSVISFKCSEKRREERKAGERKGKDERGGGGKGEEKKGEEKRGKLRNRQ